MYQVKEIDESLTSTSTKKNVENITFFKKTNVDKCKTTEILMKIFDADPVVDEYDVIRKKFKMSPSCYKNEFNTITAKIEVKLSNKYDEIRNIIKKCENNYFKESKTLSIVPTNSSEKQYFTQQLEKMKLILKLQNHFELNFN